MSAVIIILREKSDGIVDLDQICLDSLKHKSYTYANKRTTKRVHNNHFKLQIYTILCMLCVTFFDYVEIFLLTLMSS
jgi:hypothetical protein